MVQIPKEFPQLKFFGQKIGALMSFERRVKGEKFQNDFEFDPKWLGGDEGCVGNHFEDSPWEATISVLRVRCRLWIVEP